MVPPFADSSSTLVEQAVTAATSTGEDPAYVRRYLRHLDPGQVAGRSPDAVGDLAGHHRRAAERRATGESIVRVADGAIDIVTDDRPFLVDSVAGLLERTGLRPTLVIHPQLAVRRDPDGTLVEVLDSDVVADLGDDAIVES